MTDLSGAPGLAPPRTPPADKVNYPDPAAAPMVTDGEAGGSGLHSHQPHQRREFPGTPRPNDTNERQRARWESFDWFRGPLWIALGVLVAGAIFFAVVERL